MRKILALLPLLVAAFTGIVKAETVWWQCKVPGFEKPLDFISHQTLTAEGYKITQSRTIGSNEVSGSSMTRGSHAISFIEELSTGAVNAITIVLATGNAVYSSNKYVLEKDDIAASQVEAHCVELK